jgi:tetratricopeptide (TPR) repeat protein
VVLPFEKFGDDVSDHAVNAIVDDLITELSRYAGLRLTARSSAFTYKGKPIDIKGVGQDLGVRYALEGSARRHDAALAINVQLVSTETGEQFWAEQLASGGADGADAVNIVRLMGFLVQRRVFEIESARSLRERPDNPDATDALIRAYALYNMPPSPLKHDQLLGLYERAVALDPTSAAALGGLAETLLDSLPAVTSDDPTAPFKFRRAEELLGRADLLDPNEMRAMIARVFLLSRQDRCAEVISAARRTIEAHPVLSGPYQWLGICLLREGRPAEAVQQLEQAIRTNPRTPQIDNRYRLMGMALLHLERYEEAVSWFHRALAANPSLAAQTRGALYASIAAAQALSGDLETARLSAVEAKRLWPTLTARSYLLSKTTNKIGIAQANRIRDGLRAAGVRDIANEDADAGVMSDEALHVNYEAPTPVSVPGARTIRTPDLAALLAERRPLVLDSAYCYGGSIPGAVALWGAGIGGTTSDVFQERLARKMQQFAGGDRHMPIVTMGLNSERYQGRNLALRLVALGYDEVYWYRGGREAWVAAGLPAAEVALQDW